MAQEGAELAKASFGTTILLAIGKAYESQANIYLGGFIQGGLASIRQEGQSIKAKVSCCVTVASCDVPALTACMAVASLCSF